MPKKKILNEDLKELNEFNKNRKLLLINSVPEYVVYWHHFKHHKNPLKDGYIGIAFVSKYGNRFSGGLIKNYKGCQYFYNIIKKYGELKIYTTILKDGLTLAEANKIELYYRYKPNIGWNIRQGGGCLGKLSDETKSKISKSKIGTNYLYYDKIFTPESREKIRVSKLNNKNMVGKKHTEKTKEKMRISNKGISEKTRKSRFKKVLCVETNEIFNSQIEAQEKTGVLRKYISQCCTGRQKTANGYHWRYYNEVS